MLNIVFFFVHTMQLYLKKNRNYATTTTYNFMMKIQK